MLISFGEGCGVDEVFNYCNFCCWICDDVKLMIVFFY